MPIARPTLTAGYPVEVGTDGSSPRESFAPDQSTVSRQWRVLSAERLTAVPWFVGYAELRRSGGAGSSVIALERLTPQPYYNAAAAEGVTPADAAIAGVYATAVPEINPYKATGKNQTLKTAGAGTHARYDEAVLNVQYEHLPFDVLEDALVPAAEEWRRYLWLKDIQVVTETLTLPAGSRKYVRAAGTAVGSIPYGKVIQIPVTRYVLAWELLPHDLYSVGSATPTAWQKRVWGWPADAIKPLVGRVSSHDWLAWPAGTLLLEGVKPIQRRHPTVGLSWTMEVMLAHNAVGWLNAYYNAGPGAADASGWYFASSGPSYPYHPPATLPDDIGLYNVGRIEKVFDPTG